MGLYPNPVFDGDAGEFVRLSVPPGVNASTYTLTDGDATVRLPELPTGETVLSTAPNRTRNLVNGRVRRLDGGIQLANGGEVVRLVRDDRPVDVVRYRDAPEGETYVPNRSAADGRRDGEWRPLGRTDRPVLRADAGTVRAFVLPDSPDVPIETIRRANRRIRLAGYTFTSERAADALNAASERGVSVRVLVDGDPVGGITERQATVLDRLARAGVDVAVVGGDRARVRFHHAKYAVVDDRALVTTENWKPSGTGGRSSRGWGVVTRQPQIVEGLLETFRADSGWHDAIPWESHRESTRFVSANASRDRFGTQFEPRQIPVNGTRLVVAPDNAESEVRSLLSNAEESIWIEQVSVGGTKQPFVREAVDAARRGVRVRILLSGAWYVREENAGVAERLNELARRENLDLAVRLADPRGRFAKIHAKGAVVDGDRVLLGSLNWNNNSARANREVALVLEGERVGEYYEAVIRADWRGGTPYVTVGLLVVAAFAALLAVWRARGLRFDER